MLPLRAVQPFTTWLALWVLLLGWALPLLGHAGVLTAPASGAAAPWIEVCTSNGIERIWLDADPEAAANADTDADTAPSLPAHGSMTDAHCLHCILSEEHKAEVAFALQALPTLLSPWQHQPQPAARPASTPEPQPTTAWNQPPLPPRAPPLL